MARDYKNRGRKPSRSTRKTVNESIPLWKWGLSLLFIGAFVYFLLTLSDKNVEEEKEHATVTRKLTTQKVAPSTKPKDSKPKAEQRKKEEPRFDFYTILPEKEIVVPDYEIKTRVREERVGKAKAAKYILQAGSFKDYKEADSLRAKLALMGIESRVEKAKVGNVIWNRVKLGPYAKMSSVTTIKSRLKENGIDVMVTEIGG